MASPTPRPHEVEELVERACRAADHAQKEANRWRRRGNPGDPVRRAQLELSHLRLTAVAEDLRIERIRASRDSQFYARHGQALRGASHRVKRARYRVYRMLNPGGHKWNR